jgi:hypothetical protein
MFLGWAGERYIMVSECKKRFLCGVAQPGWLGTLQSGIRAQVFNTEPGWAELAEC